MNGGELKGAPCNGLRGTNAPSSQPPNHPHLRERVGTLSFVALLTIGVVPRYPIYTAPTEYIAVIYRLGVPPFPFLSCDTTVAILIYRKLRQAHSCHARFGFGCGSSQPQNAWGRP